MAKNYRDINYWGAKPEIVKIFDDLEKFHDFCRIELLPFDEANLYNRESQVWNQYWHSTRPRKPRGDFNRSGNNYKPRYENKNNAERFSR